MHSRLPGDFTHGARATAATAAAAAAARARRPQSFVKHSFLWNVCVYLLGPSKSRRADCRTARTASRPRDNRTSASPRREEKRGEEWVVPPPRYKQSRDPRSLLQAQCPVLSSLESLELCDSLSCFLRFPFHQSPRNFHPITRSMSQRFSLAPCCSSPRL